MEITRRPIDQIKPHPNNPRIKHAVDKIVNSMKEFGFTNPILIQKSTGYILAGHGRLEAAKKMGQLDVPVIELDLTDKQAKAYLITDNKLTEDAKWNDDLLSGIFKELKIEGFDLNLTGFSPRELLKFDLPQDEESEDIPDIPKEARAKRGQIFTLGKHRLMCGDSTDPQEIKILMNEKRADIMITDPPYGVSYSKKNEFLNSIDKGNHIQKDIENDNFNEKDIQIFWKKAFENVRDNLAEINSYYIFGPQIQGMMMMMMMIEAGIPYKHVIIWVKNNHVLGRCDYNYKHEPIFFGWAKTHKFYANGQFQTSVWPVDKPHKSDLHPTMKPIELIENALLNSSLSDQICLDPFLGSGSTLIACEKTQRICHGMEIDPFYCDVIIERYCNYVKCDKEEIYNSAVQVVQENNQ